MIATEQNSERQLQRLAAQRQLYASAKMLLGLQVFLGGPIAVALAIVVLNVSALKGVAAAWGILVALSDVLWLTPWQKRLRDLAARTQEAFDCDVLVLDWNEIKAGKRPDPELIKEQADKYRRRTANMPTLHNWYAAAVDDLPIELGRIACQRSNCWWDSKQRRRYAVCVIAAAATVFLLLLGFSLAANFTIDDVLLRVIAPFTPALVLGLRQYSEQMEAAMRADRLKRHSEQLWSDTLSGQAKAGIAARVRSLQDEIFENRRRSPLVFDFIFAQLRPQYEQQMTFGVEEFVAEAKRATLARST